MDYQELNLARMAEKITDIREALEVLREYASRPDSQFLGNKEAVWSARYAFILMTEAAANIASHVCAKLLARAPRTYADSFLILGEAGLLDADLASRLGKMVGFRNLLVHRYGDVDDARMLRIMREDLDDVELYLQGVARILHKAKKR
ncbi:MAG: DUF86 domain-containing protein [Clostridia bacterium]|nr:DUF86 domain-containing protein [Clostridia bacterium]